MSAETDTQAAITALAAMDDFLRIEGGAATVDFLDLLTAYNTALGALSPAFVSNAAAGGDQVRAGVASAIDSVGSALAPLLRKLAIAVDFAETDPQLILRHYYLYMIANSKYISSRRFTFGSVSAGGSNVGDATCYRLTLDENGLPIENTWAQVVSLLCVQDQNSGAAKYQETFQISGGEKNIDNIIVGGSGNIGTIQAISAANSLAYIQNPSFSQANGTALSTDFFDGWTLASGAAVTQDTTYYYRGFNGDTTPASLKMGANDTASQTFALNNTQFNPSVPMYVHVALNGSQYTASGGTVTLTFGDQTASVSIASLSAGWNILKLPLTAANWYKAFTAVSPTLSIAWASRSSGSLLIDDVTIAPMTNFDGLWYAVTSNGNAQNPDPNLVNDTYTFTDTENLSYGKIQRMLWRVSGLYLPAVQSTGITWADPANFTPSS